MCIVCCYTFSEHERGICSLVGQRAQQNLLQYNGQTVDVGGRRGGLGVVRRR